MLLGVTPPGWGGVCTRPCSPTPPPTPIPHPPPATFSKVPASLKAALPWLSRGPCGGRGTGHARAAAGRAGRRASTWLSRPPQANRAAPGGARQGGRRRRGAALRVPEPGPNFLPNFPSLGGAVSASGVEETPSQAQSRVPGRRSEPLPTVWPARAPRPQWARGAPILSRVTLDPVIHEALKSLMPMQVT